MTNECDHVVGYYKAPDMSVYLVSGSCPEMAECPFVFCPNCGAKIDWKAIKEAYDENNEK